MTRDELLMLWQESKCDYTLINDNGEAIVDIYDEYGDEIEAPLLTMNKEQHYAVKSGKKTFFDAMYDNNPCQCECMVLIAFVYFKAKEVLNETH